MSPYAKREQRFSAEGERKPKCERGSAVKDDRRGGAPGLHKRGFGSAEDRGGGRKGSVAPILDGAGIHPWLSHERARGGDSRPTGPKRSAARKHAVARMATCPEVHSATNTTSVYILRIVTGEYGRA